MLFLKRCQIFRSDDLASVKFPAWASVCLFILATSSGWELDSLMNAAIPTLSSWWSKDISDKIGMMTVDIFGRKFISRLINLKEGKYLTELQRERKQKKKFLVKVPMIPNSILCVWCKPNKVQPPSRWHVAFFWNNRSQRDCEIG